MNDDEFQSFALLYLYHGSLTPSELQRLENMLNDQKRLKMFVFDHQKMKQLLS